MLATWVQTLYMDRQVTPPQRVTHSRRPRGSESGRVKGRDESFQALARTWKLSSAFSPDPTDCPWVSEDAGYLTYLGSPPPCKRALRGPKSALACLLVGMLEWQKNFLRGLDITKDDADGMISFVNPVVLVVWCRRFYLFIYFSFILSFIIIIIIIPFSSFALELDGEARG